MLEKIRFRAILPRSVRSCCAWLSSRVLGWWTFFSLAWLLHPPRPPG